MAQTPVHGDDMATAPQAAEELHHHPGPRQYVWVAIVLAIITAAEVVIYYIPGLESVLVPFLLAFSAVKFVLVVMWFMHLKFDSHLFRRLFVTGFILAMIVFSIVLATFFLGPEAPGLTG
ncbi:MAG TPA: cytochrome C oxidase subunit IV family protein [Actinomycetota bacterium]|nr:cytochrome C oxidase subunit IV family protein [Actinomycetota bacterium]